MHVWICTKYDPDRHKSMQCARFSSHCNTRALSVHQIKARRTQEHSVCTKSYTWQRPSIQCARNSIQRGTRAFSVHQTLSNGTQEHWVYIRDVLGLDQCAHKWVAQCWFVFVQSNYESLHKRILCVGFWMFAASISAAVCFLAFAVARIGSHVSTHQHTWANISIPVEVTSTLQYTHE